MGFLDKLLGRDKEKAPETGASVGDEPRAAPAESSVEEAEERATEARDEVLGTENRIPPGSS
jgi:hypothetical protein